jgi:hypothetical protein
MLSKPDFILLLLDNSKPNSFFTQHILDTGCIFDSSDDMALMYVVHFIENEHSTEISNKKSVREVYE